MTADRMEQRFDTFDEAQDHAEALIAEDDVECEIAYVNNGKGGGYWIVDVTNTDP